MATKPGTNRVAPWARALIAGAILALVALALVLAGATQVAAIFGFGAAVVLIMAIALGFMSRRDA